MDRFRSIFKKPDTGPEYSAINSDTDVSAVEDNVRRPARSAPEHPDQEPFSWYEYFIFFMLGISMLWAWNMFLAASPYFQNRFQDNPKILSSFQSSITSVSTIANLGVILILASMQSKANYLNRILLSLLLNLLVFTLLTISTTTFNNTSSTTYLIFTLTMVFLAALATGFSQNGGFAFASSFGRPEYIQSIMIGQAVAGVLPSIAEIAAVIATHPDPVASFPPDSPSSTGPRKSALIYFMAATTISAFTLICVYPLIRRHNLLIQSRLPPHSNMTLEEAEQANRKTIPFLTLYKKFHWLAAAVFHCFAATMFFPVFTSRITSVLPPDQAPSLLQPSTFIPLSFLIWNTGDLTGRLATSLPFSLRHRPVALFIISLLRLGFLPLYLLCNLDGRGAMINSDVFYLLVVQFGFGVTNGWLGSSCMMAAGEWSEEEEREATGGFMAMNLVAGLTIGSVLSFGVKVS